MKEILYDPDESVQCEEIFSQFPDTAVNKKIPRGVKLCENRLSDDILIGIPPLNVSIPVQTGSKPNDYEIYEDGLYKFRECGKGFVYPECFLRHEATHTVEEPYKCQQCGKTFSSSSKVQRHERTQTGEKPYICNH